MYYQRNAKDVILQINDTFPILLVTGPRQVGKTTLLTKLAGKERTIVSLDNPTIRRLAREDPALFLQRYQPPILIDEVQYAPELFIYIKMYVDEHKRCGDFWLTGSQAFQMMKNVTESLAGRVGMIHLYGLSNSEIERTDFQPFCIEPEFLLKREEKANRLEVNQIYSRIYKGAMPRLYENENVSKEQYFEGYLQTYISRDVRELTQVADELLFLNFVRAVAAQTASNVNYSVLAEEVGISVPTAKQWLSLLVTTGLVILIRPFSNNALHRVIKTPRMYFMDTGLCAYLTGWSSPEVLERGAMSGAIFETWVVSEIYKSYTNAGKTPPLYFYRDSNQKEIDLLIYQNGVVNPIEIKKSAAPKNATKNFSVLQKLTNAESSQRAIPGIGAVVCLVSEVVPINQMNWYVPAWLI